jgi:hypothetical protein
MHRTHKHGNVTPSAVQDSERRGNDRVQFTIAAEVVELSSGARFTTRTTDVGPGGCFVDTTVPFPVGTGVQVRLKHAKTTFDAMGSVVYSQTGLGMGISFTELSPERRAELEAWLEDLTGEPPSPQDRAPDAAQMAKNFAQQRGSDRAMVIRLVQLLVTKRLLTEAEAASVLHDPVL